MWFTVFYFLIFMDASTPHFQHCKQNLQGGDVSLNKNHWGMQGEGSGATVQLLNTLFPIQNAQSLINDTLYTRRFYTFLVSNREQ
jgi:hypothetical protein